MGIPISGLTEMNYGSINDDAVTIVESPTDTCHTTVGDLNKYINLKTANANLLTEWINALELNGTDSYVYKNDYMMLQLLDSGFYKNSDIAKYYAIVWAGNNGINLSNYINEKETFVVTHEKFGDCEWIAMANDWEGDGTVTFRFNGIMQLMPFDAKEPSTPPDHDYATSDQPTWLRKNYGNNRYSVSNILHWMNSESATGEWFAKQHDYDEPPISANIYLIAYDTWAGFLAGFPKEFVSAIKPTTKRTALNTVLDVGLTGKTYEDITSKIWFLSRYEVNLGTTNGIYEGSVVNGNVIQKPYTCFTDNASRQINPTPYCLANDNNYTNANYGEGKPWYYLLRTPNPSYSNIVYFVDYSGTLGYNYACYGSSGAVPCLRI